MMYNRPGNKLRPERNKQCVIGKFVFLHPTAVAINQISYLLKSIKTYAQRQNKLIIRQLQIDTGHYYNDYVYNKWYVGVTSKNKADWGIAERAPSELTNPASTITVADGSYAYISENTYYKRLHKRHGKGVNVAWADGHATWELKVFFDQNQPKEKFWSAGYQ